MTQTSLQDLAWVVAVALLTAVSPFMPDDPALSLLGACVAGSLVLGFRLWRRRGEVEAGESTPSVRILVPVSVWICLVLFAVAMAPTARWMYTMWTASIWENGHSVFVPLVIVYFAHRNLLRRDPHAHAEGREERAAEGRGAEASSAWGLPFVVTGLLLVILDTAIRSRYLSAVGLLICIPGFSLLFLGARRTRKLLFPLALCFFLLPIPFSLGNEILLRDATAASVEPVLRALGYPVIRELTVLMFPNFSIDISDACSGFSALYALAFVAVILSVHTETKWRGALLLLSVWPIAVAANVVRATALVELVDSYGRGILATRVHPASGAVTFVIALAALYFVAGRRTIRATLS